MRVLYFFPDDLGQQTAGNKTRAIELLKYFKERRIDVDFAGLSNEKGDSAPDKKAIGFLKNNGLADNVYLLQRKPNKKNMILYFFRYKLWDLIYYLFVYSFKSNIPTVLTIALKNAFENVLAANTYDYIIISYVQYARLVSNKKLIKGAKTIIDTHDFITAQFKYKKRFHLGVTFQDEIERLSTFDEVWAISNEEQYIFSQFCRADVRIVPLMIDTHLQEMKPMLERNYDLIYVASDNVHNKRAAEWFFEQVYSLLPADINICVIGLINKSIPDKYKLERIEFAQNLDAYYADAKIALCPMLTGTGVKVKVVEAIAFGLPVVCNVRGVDGLPNKRLNGCLVTNDPAEFAQHIINLLTDTGLYDTQRKQAEELFNISFSKSVIYKELDNAFSNGY
jgi:glycosyltransferase involved in cell wall biosynthesis